MLKKSFKKIVAAALTAAMMMGMSTSVFAESSELFPSNTLIGQTPNGTTVSYAEAMEISDRLKNAQDNAYFIEESFAFVDGKMKCFRKSSLMIFSAIK